MNIDFIGKKAKGDACRYLKTIRESINPALYTQVVIEHVAIDITELRDVPL